MTNEAKFLCNLVLNNRTEEAYGFMRNYNTPDIGFLVDLQLEYSREEVELIVARLLDVIEKFSLLIS